MFMFKAGEVGQGVTVDGVIPDNAQVILRDVHGVERPCSHSDGQINIPDVPVGSYELLLDTPEGARILLSEVRTVKYPLTSRA